MTSYGGYDKIYLAVPAITEYSVSGNTGDYVSPSNGRYSTPYRILVKYSMLNSFLADTNWSTYHSSHLTGVASKSELLAFGYDVGNTLPSNDGNGHSIIWYCDERCTIRIYKVDTYSKNYYCTLSN